MSSEVEEVLSERGANYGDFVFVAYKSQQIQTLLRTDDKDKKYNATQREALQMIASKLSRIACGDARHRDSWIDIAGYAQLVANSLTDPNPEYTGFE